MKADITVYTTSTRNVAYAPVQNWWRKGTFKTVSIPPKFFELFFHQVNVLHSLKNFDSNFIVPRAIPEIINFFVIAQYEIFLLKTSLRAMFIIIIGNKNVNFLGSEGIDTKLLEHQNY